MIYLFTPSSVCSYDLCDDVSRPTVCILHTLYACLCHCLPIHIFMTIVCHMLHYIAQRYALSYMSYKDTHCHTCHTKIRTVIHVIQRYALSYMHTHILAYQHACIHTRGTRTPAPTHTRTHAHTTKLVNTHLASYLMHCAIPQTDGGCPGGRQGAHAPWLWMFIKLRFFYGE